MADFTCQLLYAPDQEGVAPALFDTERAGFADTDSERDTLAGSGPLTR